MSEGGCLRIKKISKSATIWRNPFSGSAGCGQFPALNLLHHKRVSVVIGFSVMLQVRFFPIVYYGRAVPDFDFTREMSALFRKPSAFRSSRKLVPSTLCPDCDFVWLISAELTNPSAFVSPTSRPKVVDTLPLAPAESSALLRVTVIRCAF